MWLMRMLMMMATGNPRLRRGQPPGLYCMCVCVCVRLIPLSSLAAHTRMACVLARSLRDEREMNQMDRDAVRRVCAYTNEWISHEPRVRRTRMLAS